MEEKKENNALPDFVELYEKFRQLGNGPIADLRRVKSVEEVADLPAYYRLLEGKHINRQTQRLAYLFPHIGGHNEEASTIGHQLFGEGIREMRLFQLLRSEPPKDIEHMRRLLIHLKKPKLNLFSFGKTVYYWNQQSKRRILRNYYTPIKQDVNSKKEDKK